MRRNYLFLSVILLLVWAFGCGGGGPTLPEKWEIPLKPAKGYKGEAKGNAVINTKTGTDISVKVSGLDPKRVYTIFFVNVKSQMFEGIGPSPHVLKVNEQGEASLEAKMSKDIYKTFIRIGVYLNPGDHPIPNPLGVKATLGELVKTKLPTMILEGKLR
jgi:hypothetical protein